MIRIEQILNRITPESWVISDTHLGHKGILDFEPSRLVQMEKEGYTKEEHERWLVDNWNKTVGPNDTVLHLGDFAFKGVAQYIEELNGNLILVLGNHEDKPNKSKFNGLDVIDGFYMQNEAYTSKILAMEDPMFSGFIKEFDGKKYMFSHYPVFDTDDWDRQNKKISPRIEALEKIYEYNKVDYSVHGHLHSAECAFENSYNTSLENLDFKPKKLKDLLGL